MLMNNPNITCREKEILQLIANEQTTKEIAKHLYISDHTVYTHRKNLLGKLGAKNTAGLVRKAFENGYLNITIHGSH